MSASVSTVDPAELRRMLTAWTTGVCVVTSSAQDGRPVGKAANSFHSVSLDPPLVGWCVDRASTHYSDWVAASGYVVHVLAEDQEDLVRRFATRGGDKFAGMDWSTGESGLPVLEGAALRLECAMWSTWPAGDHTYLVGEVQSVRRRACPPLVFHQGRITTSGRLHDKALAPEA